MRRPAVVCLTPVRNEAWILEGFLRAASQWADLIIVADQQSDDGSREIVARHEKARLIVNSSPEYDEVARQRMLIDAARALVPGDRFLLALDADEFLVPGSWTGAEWSAALGAAPGTVVRFPWLNVRPELSHSWASSDPMPFGFVDDGRDHQGETIHSPRVPVRPDSPVLYMEEVGVLHLQYVDWRRMQSKHRWYQCWERLRTPQRSAIDIYRQYHHMDSVPPQSLRPLPEGWVGQYQAMGVDIEGLERPATYRWDREVLRYFEEHGTRRFSREAVWDVDWVRLARELGIPDPERFEDPRGTFTRMMHRWLAATQKASGEGRVRIQEGILRRLARW